MKLWLGKRVCYSTEKGSFFFKQLSPSSLPCYTLFYPLELLALPPLFQVYLLQITVCSLYLDFSWSPGCVKAEELLKVLSQWSGRANGGRYLSHVCPCFCLCSEICLLSLSLHNQNWNQSCKTRHVSDCNKTALNLYSKCLFILYSKCSVWDAKAFSSSSKPLEK